MSTIMSRIPLLTAFGASNGIICPLFAMITCLPRPERPASSPCNRIFILWTCSAPSQTWRTFLNNHVRDLVSIDFFTVPTARLRVLFVFIILSHQRRRVIHFNVTEHPTSAWTAQQIIEAFPEDQAPRYLIRDRDGIYGEYFQHRVQGMGIREVRTAPRSPWQNPFVERLIGSLRRDCLNHVIVMNERHLRRILKSYFRYYHDSRTHLSLDKDPPESRPIQHMELGPIISIPQVGGLHHRYERRAA